MQQLIWISALSLLLLGCTDLLQKAPEPDVSPSTSSLVSRVPGVPADGRQVADTWCVSCHLTSKGDSAGSDVAPTWATIAADPEKTDTYLKNFLVNPHGEMQNISLSRQQIADVVAYIRTLK